MTNQSPHLTIGIAAYNGEKFISMAIESVLTQNYDNFKIIISDDCSNDDTEKICRHYAEKDTRIEYIRQEINLGSWRNYVFLYRRAKTHSKYIKFLDQDDLLVGNSLIKTLINTLEHGYDYVFSNVIIRHSDKRGIHDEHNIMSCFKGCQSNYDMAKAASIEQSMCLYSLFNIDAIEKYFEKYFHTRHLKDKRIHFLEGGFNLEIASELKSKYISTESWIYHVHGENLSRTAEVLDLIKDYQLYLGDSIKYLIFESSFNFFQKIHLLYLYIIKVKYLAFRLYGSFFKSQLKKFF